MPINLVVIIVCGTHPVLRQNPFLFHSDSGMLEMGKQNIKRMVGPAVDS